MTRHCGPQTRELLCTWTGCTPGPASRARAALRRSLAASELSGEAISDLVLAASELVANATEHAAGPYELWLRRTTAELICEVHDNDPRMPQLPPVPAAAPFAPNSRARGGGLEGLCALLSERGRGLQIVDHLTKGCWGFRVGNGKKIAWAAIQAEFGLKQVPKLDERVNDLRRADPE
ncbi:ATP-binding protein [Streptomyces sp. NPDC054933]